MEAKGYNGWKNYETWCMALWIDNDEGSYTASRELARLAGQQARDNGDDAPQTAVFFLADSLKSWLEAELPDEFTNSDTGEHFGASVWSDLLRSAFSEIDWYEIAENYLSEVTA